MLGSGAPFGDERVDRLCNEFAEHHHVQITSNARLLIKTLVRGIGTDGAQVWKSAQGGPVTDEALRSYASSTIERIPRVLEAIVADDHFHGGVVTTFHLLHWLARSLDDLCDELPFGH